VYTLRARVCVGACQVDCAFVSTNEINKKIEVSSSFIIKISMVE
jgi:hypothetical protein